MRDQTPRVLGGRFGAGVTGGLGLELSGRAWVSRVRDVRTYRFMSALSSFFTPTRFRSIRPIRSSRQMTSSWPKYRSRQGLETNFARGMRWRSRPAKVGGKAGRGSVDDDHGSRGPGTNTKWHCWRRGRERIRSVRALNPTAGQFGGQGRAHGYIASVRLRLPILVDRSCRIEQTPWVGILLLRRSPRTSV